MIIISVSHYHEPYFEESVQVENLETGRTETILLVLSRVIVATGFSERVTRKRLVKYYRENNEEIPRRKWTPEMKAMAKEYRLKYLPGRYHRLTRGGKIAVFGGAALLLFAVAAIVYQIYVTSPKILAAQEVFKAMPVPGDRYYGSLLSPEFMPDGKLQASWIIIESVSPADSLVTLRLSDHIGDFTFESLSLNHDAFNGPVFDTKFSIKKYDVQFKGLDNEFLFQSRVYSNNFDASKIPADHE